MQYRKSAQYHAEVAAIMVCMMMLALALVQLQAKSRYAHTMPIGLVVQTSRIPGDAIRYSLVCCKYVLEGYGKPYGLLKGHPDRLKIQTANCRL